MGCGNNVKKLKSIIEAFRVPRSEVAVLAKTSAAYITRLLNPSDHLEGSVEFWLNVEQSLGKIIEERRVRVFHVDAVESEDLNDYLKRIK